MDTSTQIVADMGSSLMEGLNEISEIVVDNANSLSRTAQIVCGIAAIIYVGFLIWRSWAKGESIDFYCLLRPFAIGIVILFFGAFTQLLDVIISPVDKATEYIRDSSIKNVTQSFEHYQELQDQLMDKKASINSQNKGSAEKLSVWRTINKNIGDLKEMISSSGENMDEKIYKIVIEIGSFVANILVMSIAYFYKVFVVTAKAVLILIGPFALSISLFPGFSEILRNWMSHYIKICLYIPICNIIGFVQSIVFNQCLYIPGNTAMQSVISNSQSVSDISQIDALFQTIQICTIVLSIVAIMLYKQVPQFANYIVQVSGGLLSTKSK